MDATGYRLDYWERRAREIARDYDGDPEAAHSSEDDLLAEFVTAVAAGEVPDPATAAQALRRELLDAARTRWYA